MNQERNWFCAQMGGREHYAIPRALNKSGALGGLMTDYWSGPATQVLAKYLPSKMTRSLAARYHDELPNEIVTSCNLRALAWEAQLRRMTLCGGVENRYLGYCDVGKRFALAAAQFFQGKNLPSNSVFFGYDTCSLEVMQQLKDRGVACILDQIDPCRVEIEMVQTEQLSWPGWQSYELEVPDEFYERHLDEWNIADRIVVNSEFSRGALIKQGVSAEKAVVVPLSYEPRESLTEEKMAMADFWGRGLLRGFSKKSPMRVLFLGQVMLRKGIQYLVQAAELLRDYPVLFDIVGPLNITEKAVNSASSNMIFHGRVSRDEITRWYRNAHVFILPTLSDGFAITQLEAMANGLPVIATPNCGSVVTEGVDGFLVPTRDPEAIARVVIQYLENPECLEQQHLAALEKSKQFSLDRLSNSLLAIEQEVHSLSDSMES